MSEELIVMKRCAACRKEKPVSEMKTCMHAEMHNYVCDSQCMNVFYNPPKKPAQLASTGGEAVAAACECSYGPAPHECFYKIPGAVIGESKLLPKSAWPANFVEDEACPGMGTYRCGRHIQPAPAGVVVDRELRLIEAELARITHDAFTSTDTSQELAALLIALRALLNQAGGE